MKFEVALERVRAGRIGEARMIAAGIAPAAPDYQRAQLLLADLSAREGKPEDERDHLLNAVAAGPVPGKIIGRLLEIVAAGGNAAAMQRLLPILPQRTNDVATLMKAAVDAIRIGAAPEGIALLRRLAAAIAHPQIHYNLGTALKNVGDLAGAEQALRRAVELEPDLAEAHHNLGNLLLDDERADAAAVHYRQATAIRRRPGSDLRWNRGLFEKTTRAKLEHDAQQIDWMQAEGVRFEGMERLAALYREAIDLLPHEAGNTEPVPLPALVAPMLTPIYNRLHHVCPAERFPGRVTNPDLDWPGLEERYRANDPGWVVIDDFLTEQALDALWRYCLGSTFWFNFYYRNGYLGTWIESGFDAPLLLQIAEELRERFPLSVAPHPLRKAWSFKKCDYSTPAAVGLHADFAAINTNFWITPDSANLRADGAGLIVWDKQAPLEWGFAEYNADNARTRAFLEAAGAKPIEIPYRRNRMVVFNANLFHESGPVTFAPGYANHRINVTMLFGRRGGPPAA